MNDYLFSSSIKSYSMRSHGNHLHCVLRNYRFLAGIHVCTAMQ